MRYGRRVILRVLVATISLPLAICSAHADFPDTRPTVGCQASAGELTFGGQCVGIQGPSAPTQPAQGHSWIVTPPTVQASCAPYIATEWAAAAGVDSGKIGGAVWTVDGQRIPVIYSTPLTDWGWRYAVTCGTPGVTRFVGLVSEPRTPSPCSAQTATQDCVPGLDPSSFLAAVKGEVPRESIEASPRKLGVVGVSVGVQVVPAPEPQYATINVAVPDAGDGDPGETLHVVWVVEAAPESVSWTWPDGSRSQISKWIPQTYEEGGFVGASLVYGVTATGFWSDGLTVHDLPTVSVGTIPITAQLAYSVEQVQPGLG